MNVSLAVRWCGSMNTDLLYRGQIGSSLRNLMARQALLHCTAPHARSLDCQCLTPKYPPQELGVRGQTAVCAVA